MRAPLITIARTEFVAASRLRWIRLFTLAYALITVAMAHASSVMADSDGGGEIFARLAVALQPLALTLVPLAALLVGVSSVSSDQEASGFLLTQPVSIWQVVTGRWLGQGAALGAALVAGFGAGGVIVWAGNGAADLSHFVWLVAGCLLLALAFLSVATLVAATASNRGSAVGIVTFLWFVAVILYDAVALAAALWLTGRAGTRLLFGSVFINAVDIVRILILTMAGTPHILGVAGESWMRAIGGPAPVAALAAAALSVWIALPLVIAGRVSSRRDL